MLYITAPSSERLQHYDHERKHTEENDQHLRLDPKRRRPAGTYHELLPPIVLRTAQRGAEPVEA